MELVHPEMQGVQVLDSYILGPATINLNSTLAPAIRYKLFASSPPTAYQWRK